MKYTSQEDTGGKNVMPYLNEVRAQTSTAFFSRSKRHILKPPDPLEVDALTEDVFFH